MRIPRPQFSSRGLLLSVFWFCLWAALVHWGIQAALDRGTEAALDWDASVMIVAFTVSIPVFGAAVGTLLGSAAFGAAAALALGIAVVFAFNVYMGLIP